MPYRDGSRIFLGGRGGEYECGRKYAREASGFLHIAMPTLPFTQKLVCQ